MIFSIELFLASLSLVIILLLVFYSNINSGLKVMVSFFIFADILIQYLSFREKYNPYNFFPLILSIYLIYLIIGERSKVFNSQNFPSVFNVKNLNFLSITYLKILGVILILLVLIMEVVFFDRHLSGKGILIILTGSICIFYDNIPNKYSASKDFLFLFFIFLSIFFVFPSVLLKLSNQYDSGSDPLYDLDVISHIFLTIPTSNMLNILGFNAWTEPHNILYFEDLSIGRTASVHITQECSGIFSLGIFLSAFIAFVISENKKRHRLTLGLLLLGLILSYISNILRIVVIVVVGHYWGGEALYWVHVNIGLSIFVIWFSIFWYFMSYVLGKPDTFSPS